MTSMVAPIKVLIADDQTLFRAGLVRVIGADPRFEVVAQAKNGAEAVEQTLSKRPDVVLMDLQMPEVDGVEATRQLALQAPKVKVIVLSAYADGGMLSQAIANGARGYLEKDVTPAEMVEKVLALSLARRSGNGRVHARLSVREIDVLKHVAAGLPNKEIARRLRISEKTVRNHLSRVFAKLRAGNRTEAVMNAMRSGLLVM